MDISSTLKEKDRKTYRKMSRGRRIELAIELSEFTRSLGRGVKTHGKRVQRGRSGAKGARRLKYIRDFALTGALALSALTQPRATRDIDVLISIDNDGIKDFVEWLNINRATVLQNTTERDAKTI